MLTQMIEQMLELHELLPKSFDQEILRVYEGIKDCALKNGYPRRKDGSYTALCEGFRAIAFGMQLMKEFDRPNLAAMH